MADYSVRNNVAIIELDYAPVNALRSDVRTAINDGLRRAEKDKNVKAVVLCGKRGIFCAGADIKEFTGGMKGPGITAIGDFMDNMRKPVVAAIEGVALGGGLEVALFCHYRIAAKTARVGQPEVQIGLIPGGGGTIRLPRAAGLKNALDIITTGNHLSAQKAAKMGIIDQIVSGDIVEEGIKFAQSKAHIDTSLVCLRNKPVNVDGDIDAISEAAMAKVKAKYKGAIAPIWRLPSGENYQSSRALPVRTAGVIGSGTMGGGIALCLITSGIPCILVEQNKQFLDKGLEAVKAQLAGTVRLGKMTADQAKKCFATLKPTVDIEELKNVDLVIEAVYEDLKLKREIFEKLDRICKPETILCTNTSTLDIDSISSATKRPSKVVGTHFFAPSYIMKLLENIYGTETSAETVATVMKLGKTIKKVPVLVGSCTGFVANRMLAPYSTEARFCVEEGSTPVEVDNAVMDFGMSMGTFEVSDLSGIDIGFKIKREAARKAGVELSKDSKFFLGERNCGLLEKLYEAGRMGKKNGKGWYKYDGPRSKPIVDPEVTQLIQEHCRSLGIQRRTIGSQEILERMQYSMINEGFKILEEGLCTMAEEIDIIWIYGFSWPKYMGGPMYYASQVGLNKVYEKICYYHKAFPFSMHWVPSPLLAKLSQTDLPLSQWGKAAQGSKL